MVFTLSNLVVNSVKTKLGFGTQTQNRLKPSSLLEFGRLKEIHQIQPIFKMP
jgi:hypothetical protein